MPTDDTVNASQQTEQSPPAQIEITDDIILSHPLYQELEEKHAAAENEAKSWKGRTEKLTKKGEPTDDPENPKSAPLTEEELDWKLANQDRVNLVSDLYTKHLADLQAEGAKLSPSLRSKALMLAESEYGVSKTVATTADTALPSGTADRTDTGSLGTVPKEVADFYRSKGLTDEQIQRIVPKALERQQRLGKL